MDEAMTPEQRAAMNSVFKRVQELDHENKDLIQQRARLSQRVDELEQRLKRVTAQLAQKDTLDAAYLAEFRNIVAAEIRALKPLKKTASKKVSKK